MPMKKIIYFTTVTAIIMILFTHCTNKPKQEALQYPETKKVDTVDEYFGKKIPDPYRWLEDDRSEETEAWVKAQNEVTFGYLEKIPFREAIKKRLEEIWNYPKFSVPFKEGPYYFFYKNEGMQNQSVLYKQEGIEGTAEVFLDPNKLSEDGTTALGGISISKDAKYMAYSVQKAGSDWREIRVREIATGEDLEDIVEWVKFSGMAWKDDGFYYSRYDAPKGSELTGKNEYHKVYYHKIGTPQSDDPLVYENKNHPLRNYGVGTTEDERFAFLSETESTSGNALYVKDLSVPGMNFIKLADGFDFDYNPIGNYGDDIYILTNENAPKYKLMRVKAPDYDKEKWDEVLPESENVLRSIDLAGGKIIASYMKDASSVAKVYNKDGKHEYDVELPGIGTLAGMSGKKDQNTAFYAFTSFNYPTTIFKFDIEKNTSEVYKSPEIDFKPEDYEIKQIFYASKDETKVPMFIVHKKGIEMNGQNPTLLYGYGGFNVSLTPYFSISNLILLEQGGIYALANIRGGGEYGKKWHKAGTKLDKQNVFDDFIAAAEYLIDQKYTSSDYLAINGGSNGGLLVGAVMLQRPELFEVALPAVGVLDMLRYHKFTIGWAWAEDYGTSDDSLQFFNLLKYSPLHNVKENIEYPATMITTADHDDRVVPAHSFKFAATLQEKYSGNEPMIIRIETKAGHGSGKPTDKIIEGEADKWSFIFYNMDITPEY